MTEASTPRVPSPQCRESEGPQCEDDWTAIDDSGANHQDGQSNHQFDADRGSINGTSRRGTCVRRGGKLEDGESDKGGR